MERRPRWCQRGSGGDFFVLCFDVSFGSFCCQGIELPRQLQVTRIFPGVHRYPQLTAVQCAVPFYGIRRLCRTVPSCIASSAKAAIRVGPRPAILFPLRSQRVRAATACSCSTFWNRSNFLPLSLRVCSCSLIFFPVRFLTTTIIKVLSSDAHLGAVGSFSPLHLCSLH